MKRDSKIVQIMPAPEKLKVVILKDRNPGGRLKLYKEIRSALGLALMDDGSVKALFLDDGVKALFLGDDTPYDGVPTIREVRSDSGYLEFECWDYDTEKTTGK